MILTHEGSAARPSQNRGTTRTTLRGLPNPFLGATEYCDVAHPAIQALANKFREEASSDRETAVLAFRWVRDTIAYSVGNWNRSASQVLADGYGSCSTKANLLVALLRAVGIRAAFHVMTVQGQVYFGELVPAIARSGISKKSVHVYAAVYLENEWLRCDPSDDRALSDGIAHLTRTGRFVDFDGTTDAMLNLDPSHVEQDEGPLPSIDHVLRKPSRVAPSFVSVMNHFLDFYRAHGQSFDNAETAQQASLMWTFENFPDDASACLAYVTERSQKLAQ